MQLRDPRSIRRVAIIGAGTIGASWAAHFLAQGMDVQAWDPAPGGERTLRDFVARAWPAMQRLGVAGGASPQRLSFHAQPESALDGAEFVQESGPENKAVKQALYARFDQALAPDVVMCSSTSGLIMSELQAGRPGAARFVVGHPFNPPHLIPLVEVLGGMQTAPEAVDWALEFYNLWGKKAIRLNKEVPGHLVNRLQVALWREAMDAVLSGLASVDDVDAAIAYGPGLRWGVMGPFRLCALAGGSGGYPHFLEHFGTEIEGWWRDMRDVSLTPQVREALASAVQASAGARDVEALAAQRDALLLATMETLARVRREEGYE
jgi:3-hydroxyacyl-CoA dehydrogenase